MTPNVTSQCSVHVSLTSVRPSPSRRCKAVCQSRPRARVRTWPSGRLFETLQLSNFHCQCFELLPLEAIVVLADFGQAYCNNLDLGLFSPLLKLSWLYYKAISPEEHEQHCMAPVASDVLLSAMWRHHQTTKPKIRVLTPYATSCHA